MSGSNKLAIEEFVNYLVSYANISAIDVLSKNSLQKMLIDLSYINNEITLFRSQELEERKLEIVRLTELMNTAKGLGIFENNFKASNPSNTEATNFISIIENRPLPTWYIYGEKALAEQIKILETRSLGDPFIDSFSSRTLRAKQLENKITMLNSLSLDDHMNNTSSMKLVEAAYSRQISTSKKSLIFICVSVSFFLSIFLVLMLNYKAVLRKLHN